jgi:hypothetical protein
MATYKEIFGTDVEVVSSDPANPVTGQVWYNSTTQQLKGYKQFIGNAWSTGGNLNTARSTLAGAGTQTAGLAFGGNIPPLTGATESYNGTSWTELNDLTTARSYVMGWCWNTVIRISCWRSITCRFYRCNRILEWI